MNERTGRVEPSAGTTAIGFLVSLMIGALGVTFVLGLLLAIV